MIHAHLRAAAERDVAEAVAYYRDEAGTDASIAFVDSFENAINTLQDHPLIGSLRFSYELEIPDLRSWLLQGFPYLVFYVPDGDVIDVWRVLHSSRDVPAFLSHDGPDQAPT